MKIFVCKDHDFVQPTGIASVIIAKDTEEAKTLLDNALKERGLRGYEAFPYTLQEIPIEQPVAIILQDGDY